MSIKVDQNLCIGCGACVSICPKVFKINENSKSSVISQDDIECGQKAIESCPTQAISID